MVTTFPEMTGQSFGWLTAIECRGRRKRRTLWLCRCKCGAVLEVEQYNLRNGLSKSCGCRRRSRGVETSTTHGWSKHPICATWHAMIARCHKPANTSYKYYGARGISVCQRWRDSLNDFVVDMGLPPTRRHSIERIDNDGDYEPSNCRWALPAEQSRNNRRTRLITFRGKTQCMKDWAEEMGLGYACLISRLRNGWSIERALTEASA